MSKSVRKLQASGVVKPGQCQGTLSDGSTTICFQGATITRKADVLPGMKKKPNQDSYTSKVQAPLGNSLLSLQLSFSLTRSLSHSSVSLSPQLSNSLSLSLLLSYQ
jgi:hypothetical protein